MANPTRRARPLSPDARRAQIIDAAVPLILERGAEVTTRDIADAAGIAEGTVFRAFADKTELIDAAIARVLEPAATLELLDQISPEASLETKIERIVSILHARVAAVVAFMTALGPRDHARHRHGHDYHRNPPLGETTPVIERLLEPDRDRLRVPIATGVDYLRILVFGSATPFLSGGAHSDPAELADFILRGIAAPTPGPRDA